MATQPSRLEPAPALERRDTIVIGGSSGGARALSELVRRLPPELPAALLVVTHQFPQSPGYLAEMLQHVTRIPVTMVQKKQRISDGCVYVAPPNRHMVIVDGDVTVTSGPTENRTRPAINPLFRTAAAWRSSRTVGVLLSGVLDDGVAGLAAIKRCGGIVIVQDPAEAEYPDMPRSALAAVEVDHVVRLAEMADLLTELARQTAPPADVPREVLIEARMSGSAGSSLDDIDTIGEASGYSCPSCSGPLWRLRSTDTYRCSIGHAYSPAALLGEQSEEIERALWVAVRTLDERASTLESLARQPAGGRPRPSVYEERAAEAKSYAARLRQLLVAMRAEDYEDAER